MGYVQSIVERDPRVCAGSARARCWLNQRLPLSPYRHHQHHHTHHHHKEHQHHRASDCDGEAAKSSQYPTLTRMVITTHHHHHNHHRMSITGAVGAERIAAAGNFGNNPKHCHRALCRAFGWPTGAPELAWREIPVADKDRPAVHPFLCPHEVFGALYKEMPDRWRETVRGDMTQHLSSGNAKPPILMCEIVMVWMCLSRPSPWAVMAMGAQLAKLTRC